MNQAELIQLSDKYLMHTYTRENIVPSKGDGIEITTYDGERYLDFISGIGVNCLGHSHKRVISAIKNQAERLLHVSNLYHIEPQIMLAKLLIENSFGDKVFFCNSGAEANEGAIKLARIYSYKHYGENRYKIITCYNSFHGRTMGALSATGQDRFHKGFEPLLPGFSYVPFNDVDAVRDIVKNGDTCAVMVEPIQGEGGVIMPEDGYLSSLKELCEENDILLIFDEVQTGIGKTGELFAYQYFGVEPDIMTLAKALGGGVAIGAVIAKEDVASSFTPGTHASTFGGNPLSCAAALATIETLLSDNGTILKHCKHMGDYLKNRLNELKSEFTEIIVDVRGVGLMVGVELSVAGKPFVSECLKRGVLINCTADRVLRFLPPLIVEREDIDTLIDTLRDVFKELG
ncbi:MAG: aspartate aminotransferase family protein [Nitrospirae bacterium]|nr:MAG: aspartate aminotransferase family protein [Nitrospirota bacterium]